jgi:predicted metal-binding membrane protein
MMISAARPSSILPRPTILWPIAAAWFLAIGAHLTGAAHALHHHQLIEGGPPLPAALALFLAAWQVHIGAMMLPSSLPLIHLFNRTADDQPRADLVKASFLAGYLAVWSVFGIFAFDADIIVHRLVDTSPWLYTHQWYIAGSALLVAGAFQFTDLKERCLKECRHPGVYLLRHYRRGVGDAFRMGAGHGVFCLGCCWALMLVMFGAGIANLLWMAPLTVVMWIEKAGPRGDRLTIPLGVLLLGLGALVMLQPAWLPAYFVA